MTNLRCRGPDNDTILVKEGDLGWLALALSLKTIVKWSSNQTIYGRFVHILVNLAQKTGVGLAGMCIIGAKSPLR